MVRTSHPPIDSLNIADLHPGGPGSMVVGYGIVTTCVASFLQIMSEMTIAFPTSGNFIDFAARFVDPALAFAAGMAEWLGMVSKSRL